MILLVFLPCKLHSSFLPHLLLTSQIYMYSSNICVNFQCQVRQLLKIWLFTSQVLEVIPSVIGIQIFSSVIWPCLPYSFTPLYPTDNVFFFYCILIESLSTNLNSILKVLRTVCRMCILYCHYDCSNSCS